MFSGGVDSTFTAILLAKKFDKVHLLTFNNGLSYSRPSKKNLAILIKKFGKNKFHHEIINFFGLWRRLQIRNIKVFKKYPTTKLMCLSCRMAMAALTIIYNKKHNIKHAAEGIGKDQSYNNDQNTTYIKQVESLFNLYDIKYSLPSFNYTFEEKIKTLKEAGINYKLFVKLPKTRGIYLDGQPFCFIGNILYPFWYFSNPKSKVVNRYLKEIKSFLMSYIDSKSD